MRLFFAKFNFQIGMTVFPIALFCYNELQYHEIDLCILIRQFFPLQVIGRHLCHNLQVLANSNLNNMYRYVNTQFLIFKVPHILNIFNRSPRINISLVLYIFLFLMGFFVVCITGLWSLYGFNLGFVFSSC